MANVNEEESFGTCVTQLTLRIGLPIGLGVGVGYIFNFTIGFYTWITTQLIGAMPALLHPDCCKFVLCEDDESSVDLEQQLADNPFLPKKAFKNLEKELNNLAEVIDRQKTKAAQPQRTNVQSQRANPQPQRTNVQSQRANPQPQRTNVQSQRANPQPQRTQQTNYVEESNNRLYDLEDPYDSYEGSSQSSDSLLSDIANPNVFSQGASHLQNTNIGSSNIEDYATESGLELSAVNKYFVPKRGGVPKFIYTRTDEESVDSEPLSFTTPPPPPVQPEYVAYEFASTQNLPVNTAQYTVPAVPEDNSCVSSVEHLPAVPEDNSCVPSVEHLPAVPEDNSCVPSVENLASAPIQRISNTSQRNQGDTPKTARNVSYKNPRPNIRRTHSL